MKRASPCRWRRYRTPVQLAKAAFALRMFLGGVKTVEKNLTVFAASRFAINLYLVSSLAGSDSSEPFVELQVFSIWASSADSLMAASELA